MTLGKITLRPVFKPWPKIARYRRDIVITEKIDGTNCGIGIANNGTMVYTQSRNRVIPAGEDHFGFPAWVDENAEALAETLGDGVHFGEWWGRKIGRAYDKTDRTFSLFNTTLWKGYDFSAVPGLAVVPILYEGMMSERDINITMRVLEKGGSYAAPGFMRPEGVIVYHTAANLMFKITIEHDEVPKGMK